MLSIYAARAESARNRALEGSRPSKTSILVLVLPFLIQGAICSSVVRAFAHGAMGRSSQCSTTGATNVVVCVILSVNIFRFSLNYQLNELCVLQNNAYSPDDEIYLYGSMSFDTMQPWYVKQKDLTLIKLIHTGRFAQIYTATWKGTPKRDSEVIAKMMKGLYLPALILCL